MNCCKFTITGITEWEYSLYLQDLAMFVQGLYSTNICSYHLTYISSYDGSYSMLASDPLSCIIPAVLAYIAVITLGHVVVILVIFNVSYMASHKCFGASIYCRLLNNLV